MKNFLTVIVILAIIIVAIVLIKKLPNKNDGNEAGVSADVEFGGQGDTTRQ